MLAAELLLAGSAGASGGVARAARYLLYVEMSRIRLHPLHSRLCASVAPVAAHLDPADSLRRAASTCLGTAVTQLLWAAATAGRNRHVLAFELSNLFGGGNAAGDATEGEGEGAADEGASATHVVTVSVMDMRGRMEQISFAVKAVAAPVEGGAAALPAIASAAVV